MTDDLSTRQAIEKEYHNEKYKESSAPRGSEKDCWYGYFFKLFEDVEGLEVLDFGCGDGWNSIQLAQKGAHVSGIDISEALIERAKKNAAEIGCAGKTKFYVTPGESMAFNSESFDLVVGSAVLHHTEIKITVEKISQVLKPSGRAIFIEPMNENPLLKTWRYLTPWRRTPVERALLWDDVLLIRKHFPGVEEKYFCLSSMLGAFLKLVFPSSKIISGFDNALNGFDQYLLNKWPGLGRYCAVVVLDMKKA